VKQFWRLPALPGAHSCEGIRKESNPYFLATTAAPRCPSQACSDRDLTQPAALH